MSDLHDADNDTTSEAGNPDCSRRQFGVFTVAAGLLSGLSAAAAAQAPDQGGQRTSPVAGPKPLGGELRALKIVPTEPTPATLFVCSAKVRSDAAAALRARFSSGAALPKDLQAVYDRHLMYSRQVGEQFYEAGPAADFTEILYIYRTTSLADAKALMQADPLFRAGIFHDDSYFPWSIHCPSYKSGMPGGQPEQVLTTEVEVTTPRWLVAAHGSYNLDMMMREWGQAKARPLAQLLHDFNMFGQGGLQQMGIAWGCGPAPDFSRALHIFAVPTVAMAEFYNASEALYRWGATRDWRYFEWRIHYPLRKASPDQKPLLAELYQAMGITVAQA